MNQSIAFFTLPNAIGTSFDEIPGNAKAILLCIMGHLPNAFPSVKRIAAETGLCTKTVFKHLRILESNNFIRRLRRSGTSNVYKVAPNLLVSKLAKKFSDIADAIARSWNERISKPCKNRPREHFTSRDGEFSSTQRKPREENIGRDEIFKKIGFSLRQMPR